MKTYDLLIIGAGPAGLAAGIQAAHLGMDHVVIEREDPQSRLKLARRVENFPLLKTSGIPGKELHQALLTQALRKGVVFKERMALSITKTRRIFAVETEKGSLGSKAAIIATGLIARRLDEGIASPHLEGRRLFSRWTDIPPTKDKKEVLVIGGGEVAFDQACSLAERGFDVAVAVRGTSDRVFASLRRESRALGISVEYNVIVRKIAEDDNGIVVSLKNWEKVVERKYDHCLVAIGSRKGTQLISGKNLPGIYLAGDLAHPQQKQAAAAFGDGIRKTMMAYNFIRTNRG